MGPGIRQIGDDAVAAKDRLYRALDKALEHKEALERHLTQHWRDLFGVISY